MENTSSGRGSADPHHPAVLSGILDSSGLAAILGGLEPSRFLYLVRSSGDRLAMPHTNLAALHPSSTAECDWLVAEQIRKTCRSFRCRL
jgi:hypothetical protein